MNWNEIAVLVTGGSGFLGSHVADELSKRGHNVTIFDKKKSKWIRPDQKMYLGDILNAKDLENVIKGADAVFHFAALADLGQALKEPINTARVNILGTVLSLDLCRKHNIKRFVYASTIYVNSIEGGFYRSSKKAAEDYVEEYYNIHGLNFTILRYGSIYGKRSDKTNGVTNIIQHAIKTGKITYFGSEKSVREYIHVLDVAKASVDILKEEYKNKHIILAGQKSIKVNDFLKILAKILKVSDNIEFQNKKYTGHYETTPFTYKLKPGEKLILDKYIDYNKGLAALVSEIKKNNNEKNY